MKCGCTTTTCGCCEGVQILTPLSTENRPGLPAISYRVGTHGAFFETMQARLSTMSVALTDPVSGNTVTYTPLTGLTTRNPSDPSIALLDAWATVGDVLSFYQERIANEGYLGTATELQSVSNLAYLVGYEPRPGVSASVYLAFTVDPNQTVPTDVPPGTQAQSIPGPGELPQTFETTDDFEARVEWNNLQVQMSQPQQVLYPSTTSNPSDALNISQLFVAGTATSLKQGDQLLFLFSDDASQAVIRIVSQITPDYTAQTTNIQLQPISSLLLQSFGLMQTLYSGLVAADNALANPPPGTHYPSAEELIRKVERDMRFILLGGSPDPGSLANDVNEGIIRFSPATQAAAATFTIGVKGLTNVKIRQVSPVFATQVALLEGLLEPLNVQARSSADLQRSIKETFAENADVHPRLLQVFAPALENTLYPALEGALFDQDQPTLLGVYAFRSQSPLFGSAAANKVTVGAGGVIDYTTDWQISDTDKVSNVMYLGQPNDSILPQSYALIQVDNVSVDETAVRMLKQIQSVKATQRSDYNLTAKTTQLTLVPSPSNSELDDDWLATTFPDLRQTLVYGQTDEFTLTDIPLTDDISGQTIELDQVYNDLQSGRYVVLTGERTDIPGVTGVMASELLMVSSIIQTYDSTLPGDSLHSQLNLATPMAYTYLRSSVTINANVVAATNGATWSEVLGSGNGSQSLQSFTLKQPPLTFVPAPNPQGIVSTLEVYVNGVQWTEAPSLADMGPKDHEFITQTSAGQTTVIFGNGTEGARLPTGVQNVVARYRSGIGSAGNVDAGQISLMQTKPLGIQGVINGTAATGGADPEDVDTARVNAPLAVMALDRLVSIEDYAEFARTFAGIGKAASLRITNGVQQLVHVTIAGVNDIPIDVTSDLYLNLVLALENYGIDDLPIQVDPREMLALVLSANVNIDSAYQWDLVSAQIRACILAQFGFTKRYLGQSIELSQVISVIQAVPGVTYVSVQAFGGIPDRRTVIVDGIPTRQYYTPAQIADLALRITRPETCIIANLAAFDNGAIRPAQIAMFVPDIPETVILNQIS